MDSLINTENRTHEFAPSPMIPFYSTSRVSKVNKYTLHEMLRYISNLRKEERINEQQYSDLIIMSCINFIENEIEYRIGRNFVDKLSRAMKNIK